MEDTAPQVLTLAAVLDEFGEQWQVHQAEFCWVAVRRPTPTSQEIVTGQDLHQLAVKLRNEA